MQYDSVQTPSESPLSGNASTVLEKVLGRTALTDSELNLLQRHVDELERTTSHVEHHDHHDEIETEA